MSSQKTITIQLDEDEYEQLKVTAKHKGVQPDALVRSYLHDGLHNDRWVDPERRKEAMLRALDALDQLAEMRADLPPVDAVEIARESREELERRSIF